jgi:acetolactate synthase I/II/III large subunit
VKPIWDELASAGVRIVSARHEGAVAHMAQAEADLTGELAVAIVTTGPGLTNAVTGIACAHLARSPVLVLSATPPRPQAGMGALEEVAQARIVEPITRLAASVTDARHVPAALDRAIAAAIGEEGPPGPAYLDLPTDLLTEASPPSYVGDGAFAPRRRSVRHPDGPALEEAAELIRSSRRPLVLAGADVKRVPEALTSFLDATGALFLDTRASKGALAPETEGAVPGMRVRAMAEADLVVTAGRVLDFELAYGSPAVFSARARFLRIGRTTDEVAGNRRGDVELRGDVGPALEALVEASAAPRAPDREWRAALIRANGRKAERLAERIANEPPDEEGRLHPYNLIAALNEVIDSDTIVVADGGDILAFARVALRAPTYLDLGPFGCLGVGVPFANAAALAMPGRRVVALIGDGAFGFNCIEVETAVREKSPVVLVIANNSAWNIERHDQIENYGGRILGTELSDCSYSGLAEALGAHGERVEQLDELRPALERALANAPALVDVRVSRAPVSPDSRSGLAAVPPLQAIGPWDEAERLWLFRSKRKESPMSVTTLEVPGRERPRGYSDVATAGGIVAVAGQLPSTDVLDEGGGLADQFASAMSRFVEALSAAGAGVDNILMMRVYVTNMEEYKASLPDLGPVFRETFENQYPATTLVEVSGLVDERAMVEIEGLAARG